MLQINRHTISVEQLKAFALLGLFLVTTLATSYIIYLKVQQLFRSSIDERLLALTSAVSTQFLADELDEIGYRESVESKEYRDTVIKLQKIKNSVNQVKWAYIFRKTDDPLTLEFVADADSLNPALEIDLNEDGKINEEDQLNYPGDSYDISDVPEYGQIPFIRPYVDPEPYTDQWGTILAGSAPIYYKHGAASKYIIGIDIDITDFYRTINIALIPFVLFTVFLFFVLTAMTVIMRGMWKAQVELLRELDRQKDELMSLVSHQLATPVSSIKWYLEMMEDGDLGKLSDEQKEHVKTMTGIGNNLTDLVSMILDVSRIQLGRVHIEKQELNLKELFKEILDEVEPKSKEKSQNFEVHLPEQWPKAMLDRRYTRMTIENLLTNAIKYTPEKGTVKLTVTIKDGVMHCEVKDTGCGIPKADQDKIFGRMFRASNVRNSIDGNGFGLYIAKGAVEAQGGKIWFESEENKGTTFGIELPLMDVIQEENARKSAVKALKTI